MNADKIIIKILVIFALFKLLLSLTEGCVFLAPPAPAPPRIADDNITPTTITIVLTPTSDSKGEVV